MLLTGISPVQRSINVKVANGQVIQCSSELKQAKWSIQGYEFATDLKTLPLPYYDLIIGVWLARSSQSYENRLASQVDGD
jgi:hypothetical protein